MPLPSPIEPARTLRIPASTSNLGPGFDLLGLALTLWLEVELERTREDAPPRIVERGGEAAAWPAAPQEDLVLRALAAVLRHRGRELPRGLCLRYRSEIPVQRGLGSSGAAVTAGLLLGAALLDEPPAPDELLSLGIALEGHPDNVAASLHGGLTLCHPAPDADGPLVVSAAVHPSVAVAVAWPEAPQSTAAARRALPAAVPFEDAVENPRRLALLLEGLRTADPRLLAAGSQDRLHERHRLRTIAGGREALAAARRAGAWSAHVSGSGSALVALGSEEALPPVAAAMQRALEAAGQRAWSRVCAVHRAASRPPA